MPSPLGTKYDRKLQAIFNPFPPPLHLIVLKLRLDPLSPSLQRTLYAVPYCIYSSLHTESGKVEETKNSSLF